MSMLKNRVENHFRIKVLEGKMSSKSLYCDCPHVTPNKSEVAVRLDLGAFDGKYIHIHFLRSFNKNPFTLRPHHTGKDRQSAQHVLAQFRNRLGLIPWSL